jgi:hypothetical protein
VSEFSPPPPIGRIRADGTAEITPRDLEAISAWLQQNNISRTATTDTLSTSVTALEATVSDDVVTLTDTQTLTQKTLTAPALTSPVVSAPVVTGGTYSEPSLDTPSIESGVSTDLFEFAVQAGPPFSVASNAQVTNLNAALLNGMVAIDEDNMASNSATSLPTQQSVKAYVDDEVSTLATKGQWVGVNTQTGTTYTLVIGDKGKVVEMNNGSSNTCTVPPNSSVAFPVGSRLLVTRYGAGSTTIVAGSGVTLRSSGSVLAIDAQYGVVEIYKRATDEWVVYGDI